MEKDPKLMVYLLATCGLVLTGLVLQWNATLKLAKWLFQHRHAIWIELGRPGSFFFKGESDNPCLKRTTALNAMYKSMPLQRHRCYLNDEGAEGCIKRYHLGGILAGVSMVLFAFGVIYGAARDQRGPDNSVRKLPIDPAIP